LKSRTAPELILYTDFEMHSSEDMTFLPSEWHRHWQR